MMRRSRRVSSSVENPGPRVAGQGQLLLRFQPDHRLVQQHVVEHRAERVVGIIVRRGILDSF